LSFERVRETNAAMFVSRARRVVSGCFGPRVVCLAILLSVAADAPFARAQTSEQRDTITRPRVEVAGWVGGAFIANHAPYGASYVDENALYGGEIGVLFPNRLTIGVDGAFALRQLSDGSWGGGTTDTHSFAAQTGSISAGYDFQWGRFHLRPTLGATLIRGAHWHHYANSTSDTTTRTDLYELGPSASVVLQLDLTRALYLRGVVRSAACFRVASDGELSSLMNRDIAFMYFGAIGVDF